MSLDLIFLRILYLKHPRTCNDLLGGICQVAGKDSLYMTPIVWRHGECCLACNVSTDATDGWIVAVLGCQRGGV